MSVRRLWPAHVWALPAMLVLGAALLRAQERAADPSPKLSLREIQRIAVPEDEPKQWPFRDQEWIPIPRDDYVRRLSRLLAPEAQPSQPVWERVRYAAMLTGDSLTNGRLTGELHDVRRQPRLLPLGNPSLALEELSWSGEPALWGTGLDGRHWLLGNSQPRLLEGRWSARGRPLETGVAFELSLLSAAVSELELQVPTGQVVASDVGDVEAAPFVPSAEWQTWRVSLGNHSRCRLIVTQPVRTGLPIPTMLYEQEQAVTVGQEELQVAQTFLVESLGGSVPRLTISMPRAVEIVSATAADQTPLTLERILGEGPASQIVVTFPDEIAGRRSFRLDGFVRRAPGEQFAVPQFVLEGGLWTKGRVNITIGRPLELRSYRSAGYRQTVPASAPADSEMISFQQILPRAQLLLNVERPNVERLAYVINHVEASPRHWTLTAEFAWQSRAGTVFDAACRIPDGFQVLSVSRLRGGAEPEELTDWTLEPHPDSGQVLRLDFPDGLTPGRVDSLRITTQRDVIANREPATVPLVTPVDCEFSEVLLLIDGKSRKHLSLTPGDQFEPFDLRSPASVWNTLPAWLSAWNDSGDGVLLHVIHPESPIPLANIGSKLLGDVAAELHITLRDSQIHERYEVRLDASPEYARTVELQFTENTPGIRWSDPADPESELSVQRRPGTAREADRAGETAVITLPSRDGDSQRLIGVRVVPWSSEYSIPVVLAPRARQFTGRIRLVAEAEKDAVLTTEVSADDEREARSASTTDSLISGPVEWTYHDARTSWRVRPRDRAAAQSGPWSYHLRSMFAGDGPGYDYHELRAVPAAKISSDGLRFTLSPNAEFLAAWWQDQTLDVSHDGDAWTIVGGGLITERSELVLTYRIPTQALFCRTRHPWEVPQLSGACTGFTWQIAAARTVEFLNPPFELAMTPAPVRPNWWQRLRGPLSHSADGSTHRMADSSRPTLPVKDSRPGQGKISLPESAVVYELSSPQLPPAAGFITWDKAALQLTTWLCLLGCLPAGWLFRKGSGDWRNQLLALLLAVSACLTVFGPVGWNELSGGVFAGLVMSLLLPGGSGKFAQPAAVQPVDRSASTEIFRRAAVPFVLWLAVSPMSPGVLAQPSVSPDSQRAKDYRVLMPVDRRQRPSEKLPLVYVSRDLNNALLAVPLDDQADPSQLVTSAEYLVYQDQSRRQMLRIQYQVACLTKESQRTLQVPLAPVWRRHLESCFVDGQPQAATTAPDENSLLIPVPEPADRQPEPSRHSVRLEVPLPQSQNPQTGALHGAIFPALNSRLSWQSPEALGHVLFPATHGSLNISLDRRLVEAHLGDLRELSLRQTSAESTRDAEGRTELHLLQILTLRPMLTQVTFRVECRVLEGAVHRLEADLPPGGVLRDLRAHKELHRSIVPQSDGGTRAIVEFSEPQQQDFVVEGEYVLPRSSLDEAVELPRLQVRSGTSGPARHSVAVASPSEFTAQLINLDDPAVLPILVDAFFTQWGDTFPNQRPQFAFQVQDGGRPSFRLSTVQSDQQVVNWHENVALSRKGLDWELRAEMKTTAWPAHSFTVLLDRRLSLDAVSVMDNGDDLLARITKTPIIGSSQNRLTMFLNREATGTCQVRIHGTIRYRPTSSMSLPTVRFETPQSVPGTLALFHESGFRLQLDGKPLDLAAPVSPELLPADQPHLPLFKQFKLAEGDPGLTARLEPVSGGCTVRSLWLVELQADTRRVRGWMELTPEDGTREVRVVLPDWLQHVQVSANPDEPAPLEEIQDGQSVLTVVCSGREALPQRLQWDVELPVADQSAMSWKLPTVPQASRQSELAALVSADDWIVSGDDVISVNEMPVVVREQLTQWQAASVSSLTQLPNHTLAVRRVDAKSPDGRSSVVLVEHLLRGTPDGTWLGESMFSPSESEGIVEVQLPEGLEILALLTDHTLVPQNEPSGGRLWRIADAGRYRRLTVRWKSALAGHPLWPSGRMTLPLPECRQARRPTTWIGMLGPLPSWMILPRHLQHTSGASLAIQALEVEIQRARNLADSGEPDAAAGQRIWKDYQAAADLLADARTTKRLTADDWRRWEAIVQFVNQLDEVSPPAHELARPADHESRRFADSDAVFGVLTGETAEFHYWCIRRSLVTGVSGTLLLLAGLWLLPKVTRWLLSPGWKQHRPAAWLLFGVVWWICWSPSIIAWAMLAWAVFEWRQKRRAPLVVTGQ